MLRTLMFLSGLLANRKSKLRVNLACQFGFCASEHNTIQSPLAVWKHAEIFSALHESFSIFHHFWLFIIHTFKRTVVIYLGLLKLRMMNSNLKTFFFCCKMQNYIALSEIIMHNYDTYPMVCVNFFCWYSWINNSATNMNTHVLPFFHVCHAGNKLTVAWVPAPRVSQVNHLALLCNTDHHYHYQD